MVDRKILPRLAAAVVLGGFSVLPACKDGNEDHVRGFCVGNGISSQIPGSSKEIKYLNALIEEANATTYSLVPITDEHDFFEKVGSVFNPDDSGLVRPQTAAVVREQDELIDSSKGYIVILTDRQYTNRVVGTKTQGVLSRQYGNSIEEETVEIKISDIKVKRAEDEIDDIDAAYASNALVKVEFDLSNSPFRIDNIGSKTLKLLLSDVDCTSGRVIHDSLRMIILEPVV